jgi:hypothetical protein
MKHFNRQIFIQKYFFLILSLIVATIVSIRIIPDTNHNNDTGRYIKRIYDINTINEYKTPITEIIYYKIMRSVFSKTPVRSYLFFSAIIIPFILIFFIKCNNGDIWLLLAILLSVSYFELTTNALREGIGIVFIIIGIKYRSNKICSYVFLVFSVLIHHYALLYLCFYFIIDSELFKIKKIIIKIVLISILIYYIEIIKMLYNLYSSIYESGKDIVFNMFMVLPILMIKIFIWRFRHTCSEVNQLINYISFLILFAILQAPAIMYRLTVSGYIIILISLIGMKQNINVKKLIFMSSFMQLLVYIIISSNVRVLWV